MEPINALPLVIPAHGGRNILVLGNEIEIKLDSHQTAGSAFVFENTTPPGDGVPPHIHSREDEIIRVLEGEYEIFLHGRTYTAAAGAVANFPRNVVHAFRNVSSTPARALFIVTPGLNFETFMEELSAAAPTMPADMDKVMDIFSRYGLPILQPAPAA